MTEIQFERIYEILSSSLPQKEMRSKDNQKQLLRDHRYSVITAEDNGIIGFIAIWKLTGLYFVEHFAVDEKSRNCGVGKELLKQCTDRFSPIVLEVEPKGSASDAERRIDFYKRNGFLYNDYEYFQPPLQDEFPLLPLKIMSYPTPLDLDSFKKVQYVLYKEIYNF